jgi:outer membrane scaffolding protein for murein synthesis (MipA/OmpV family)
MKNVNFKAGLGLIMGLALSVPVAHAQLLPPVDVEEVNLVGIAAGVAPDYMGSGHTKGAGAPLFRYQFSGTQRYVAWVGPTGYFLQYRYKLSEQKMHQILFTIDVAGSGNGTVGNPRVLWWQPLGPSTLLNVGLGTTIANGKWMQTYFGVTNASDIALYPSLGGQPFNAGSGVKGVNIPFGITQALSKEWLLSVGGRYEKLMNDAKDSPVTSQRGKDNQWIGGVGISYLF